ncbi:MAG: sensor histidine kinase [Janthinobacterium lividum]
MRRALEALLANALEAVPDGGEVTVAATRVENRLILSVADTGAGPPESIATTLFDPFVTGHPERAGLGLSIVREIARAHGGSAYVERRGLHTLFLIGIPWPTC